MAYLTRNEAMIAGVFARVPMRKSAGRILAEDAETFSATKQYDIFLSHSFEDADVILGVKKLIQSHGLDVYVDWIDDPKLDRSNVTPKSAAILRTRLQTCKSLVYVHSTNSSHSVWMPWELGYFDGMRPQQFWILPLVADSDDDFKGQEYLGLYPAIDKLMNLSGKVKLGFANVGPDNHEVPLEKAAKGHGVYF